MIFVDNDKANESISKTEQKASGLGTKFGSVAKGVGKAAVVLGGEVIAAGGAIMGMANKSAETADEIDKMSSKIGISKKGFQEWKYIMGQNGMEVEKMQVGVKTLTSKMDGVKNGNKSAIAAFKELGVQVTDSKGKFKSQEEVMTQTIKKLAEMPEGAERAKLATELFGKAGLEMGPMLNAGAKGIDELKNRAHDLGLVLSDDSVNAGVKMGDLMDDVKSSFGAVVTKIGAELFPHLNNFLEWILGNMPTIQSVLGGVFSFLSQAVTIAVDVIKTYVVPVFQAIFTWFITNLPTIQNVVITVFNAIKSIWDSVLKPVFELLYQLIQSIVQWVQANWPTIQNVFTTVFNIISSVVSFAMGFIKSTIIPIFQSIIQWVQANWPLIKEIISTVINEIQFIVQTVLNAIRSFWNTWGTTIMAIVNNIFNGIKIFITGVLNVIKGIINIVMGIIHGDWSRVWNGIKQVFSGVWTAISGIVQAGINYIRYVLTAAWAIISSTVSTVWNGIKGVIIGVWNGIKSGVNSAINGVKSTIESVWNGIKNTTSTVWNGIKSAIETPINKAKSIVSGVIDSIKGFFSFKISWPHIPMPHFGITPSGWKIGDLLKGSIPKLGINWYADGGILTKPTIFGASGNRLNVGGEAGPEAVLPLSKLPGLLEPFFLKKEENNAKNIIFNNHFSFGNILDNEYVDFISQKIEEKQREALLSVGGV